MKIKLTAAQLDELREWLIQNDGLERFAFVSCSRRNDTLLVEEVDTVDDGETSVQHNTGIEVELEDELDRINDCLERGQEPVLVHSHPFTTLPSFSGRDHEVFKRYHDWLGPLYPERSLGFMVVGQGGLETTVYERLADDDREDLNVEVIGDWKAEHKMDYPTPESTTTEIDAKRYDRTVRALGKDGQAQLADTKVAVVGIGGLGSMIVEQLARLGIRNFVLIDPDEVEESNLPRIYGATDVHIGRPKTEVVKQHLWKINPETDIETYCDRVQNVAEDTLPECDVIVGAVDRVNARSYLNEFAIKHMQYYLDAGVVIKTIEDKADENDGEQIDEELGIVQTVVPGVNGCLSCLNRHDPERARLERLSEEALREEIDRGYIESDIMTPQPAVTPLNGVIAAQTSRILAKLVTGYADPPDLLQYRGLEGKVEPIMTHQSSSCIVCGKRGVLGKGNRTSAVELTGSEQYDSTDREVDTKKTGIKAETEDDSEGDDTEAKHEDRASKKETIKKGEYGSGDADADETTSATEPVETARGKSDSEQSTETTAEDATKTDQSQLGVGSGTDRDEATGRTQEATDNKDISKFSSLWKWFSTRGEYTES
jgi:molybdopterin/thiamine biosynthesis adenylyltransferase